LFYPAAENASFLLMISGLFIVGLGFSLQQIAANALVVALGDPKTGAQRLSLTGGVNNFGTTIGPLLVSLAIFGSLSLKTGINISLLAATKPQKKNTVISVSSADPLFFDLSCSIVSFWM